MIRHTDEFIGMPPDVLAAVKKIIVQLETLTLIEQQYAIEMLAVRHILHRSYPSKGRAIDLLEDMILTIVQTTKGSMEETQRAAKLSSQPKKETT